MAQPKQPQPPSPNVNAFIQGMTKLAQTYRVGTLVVILRDPVNGEARFFGAPQAVTDLRDIAKEKFGFDDAETGWPA